MKLTNQLIISLLVLTNRDLLSFSNIYSSKLKNIKKCFTIEIAESCARDVGPSKYYAIALLQSLNIEYENTDCIEEEEPRKSNNNNEAKDIENDIEFTSSRLYDINGKFICIISKTTEIFNLNIPIGVYTYSYLNNNKVITKKIFKL